MIRIYLLSCLFGITVCFLADAVANDAIIGGEIASANQFPYIALLVLNGREECGAGIIGGQFVITAAHCVMGEHNKFKPGKMAILAGTNDVSNFSPSFVAREVSTVYVPREYHHPPITSTGDIAVLELKHPLPLSEHVQKIELPQNQNETFAGKKANLTAFGWDWIKIENGAEVGGNTDTKLRFAEADVLSDKHCAKDYDSDEKLLHNLLCARIKQRDNHKPSGVCFGDSGAPLVHNLTVIGILSHGPFGCSEKTKAGVYTRVSNYVDFVHNAIAGRHAHGIRVYKVQKKTSV